MYSSMNNANHGSEESLDKANNTCCYGLIKFKRKRYICKQNKCHDKVDVKPEIKYNLNGKTQTIRLQNETLLKAQPHSALSEMTNRDSQTTIRSFSTPGPERADSYTNPSVSQNVALQHVDSASSRAENLYQYEIKDRTSELSGHSSMSEKLSPPVTEPNRPSLSSRPSLPSQPSLPNQLSALSSPIQPNKLRQSNQLKFPIQPNTLETLPQSLTQNRFQVHIGPQCDRFPKKLSDLLHCNDKNYEHKNKYDKCGDRGRNHGSNRIGGRNHGGGGCCDTGGRYGSGRRGGGGGGYNHGHDHDRSRERGRSTSRPRDRSRDDHNGDYNLTSRYPDVNELYKNLSKLVRQTSCEGKHKGKNHRSRSRRAPRQNPCNHGHNRRENCDLSEFSDDSSGSDECSDRHDHISIRRHHSNKYSETDKITSPKTTQTTIRKEDESMLKSAIPDSPSSHTDKFSESSITIPKHSGAKRPSSPPTHSSNRTTPNLTFESPTPTKGKDLPSKILPKQNTDINLNEALPASLTNQRFRVNIGPKCDRYPKNLADLMHCKDRKYEGRSNRKHEKKSRSKPRYRVKDNYEDNYKGTDVNELYNNLSKLVPVKDCDRKPKGRKFRSPCGNYSRSRVPGNACHRNYSRRGCRH